MPPLKELMSASGKTGPEQKRAADIKAVFCIQIFEFQDYIQPAASIRGMTPIFGTIPPE